MNLFRNLLFWIVLALLAAFAAQLLVQDPGLVLVRYRGYDYTTTLAVALFVGIAVLLGLWLVWKLVTLPIAAVRRRRERRNRALLTDGFEALEHGHWSRAEKSLLGAAEHDEGAGLARIGAARAAASRGDMELAQQYLDALPEEHAGMRAVAFAEFALAHDRPSDALTALDAPAAQPLPPRGLALRADALARLGRAGEAYGLLGALRQQHVWPPAQLARHEATWAEAGLREAGDANALADRWDAMPKPLRSDPAIVAAYAERAAALRWDEAAAKSIEDALDANWNESLAAMYGRLSIGRLEHRRERAERWLQAHPRSPGLLLTLARLNAEQGLWPQSEDYLHRAIAQGAGRPAWEALGEGYAAVGDDTRARIALANALRAGRGDALVELPGRELHPRALHDGVVAEDRDEHGVPRLRG
ncbi:heme biosynthesis protein HemY [Lysobacter korlensis]|uniref:Heme biosynthesis protein HemY n=1 Tax=Lysobacter korlensis TaxID=553636 RepID=A0ABV6RJD8_9GAMM